MTGFAMNCSLSRPKVFNFWDDVGCKLSTIVTLKYCLSTKKGEDTHELHCNFCRTFAFDWSQNTELCEMALIHFTMIHLYLFLGMDCITTRSACPLGAVGMDYITTRSACPFGANSLLRVWQTTAPFVIGLFLFFWHSWHSNLKGSRALVMICIFTLCLVNYAVTTPMACGDEHAWRRQKSEPRVAPVSYFHDHITIYDTMPWVVFRTERLTIWTSPTWPLAQIYWRCFIHFSKIVEK